MLLREKSSRFPAINRSLPIAGAVLSIMPAILDMNRPCQFAALHGLNHLALDFPVRVRQTIDAYIVRMMPDRELLSYAKVCQDGSAQ
jgi:hypothetical protein